MPRGGQSSINKNIFHHFLGARLSLESFPIDSWDNGDLPPPLNPSVQYCYHILDVFQRGAINWSSMMPGEKRQSLGAAIRLNRFVGKIQPQMMVGLSRASSQKCPA